MAVVRAYSVAGSQAKRRLLRNALMSSFHPRFYQDGMYKHLMPFVMQLEVPELAFLRSSIAQHMESRSRDVRYKSREYFLARRLATLGLMVFERAERPPGHIGAIPCGVAVELVEFVADGTLQDR